MKSLLTRLGSTLVVCLSLCLASCTEKDPFPLSNSSFVVSTVAPEKHLPVKFENLSTNASRYEWDFGDGTEISTEIAPIHTYEESGEFIVSLTAITADGQKSTETRVIKIGERYLSSMVIYSINMTDGTNSNDGKGDPWDEDGSGPDVLMQFGPTTEFEKEDGEIVGFFVDSLDVGGFKLPIGITTNDLLPSDFKLTDEEYTILLEEVDTVDNEPLYEQMVRIRFNPVIFDGESITEIKRENGTGDLTIPFVELNEYQFLLEFVIR